MPALQYTYLLGCGATDKSLPSVEPLPSPRWCCAEGRVFLIWALCCGFKHPAGPGTAQKPAATSAEKPKNFSQAMKSVFSYGSSSKQAGRHRQQCRRPEYSPQRRWLRRLGLGLDPGCLDA